MVNDPFGYELKKAVKSGKPSFLGGVTKGDVPGHPFHGNQYSGEGGGSTYPRSKGGPASPRTSRMNEQQLRAHLQSSAHGFQSSNRQGMKYLPNPGEPNAHTSRADLVDVHRDDHISQWQGFTPHSHG